MKVFNTTGICHPDKNYMVDTSIKIDQILALIYQGKYFVINRPRQYGKTTTLFLLERKLLQTTDYFPISLSFEGVGEIFHSTEENFCKSVFQLISLNSRIIKHGYQQIFIDKIDNIKNFLSLSIAITEVLTSINKKFVLMIDEVDKSSNNRIFLHFLGLLRNKYLDAQKENDTTFHSVVLAGVTDIKNLKLKIKQQQQGTEEIPPPTDTSWGGLNSPWNIAIDFKIKMCFSAPEIKTMLDDYNISTNNQMDTLQISERLHFWTNGYPFLVSKLCLIVEEDIISQRDKKKWETEDIDTAANLLLKDTNTLFDDITKNLENHSDLYDFIKSIVLGAQKYTFESENPIHSRAAMYGLIDKYNDRIVKIHNKIFEEKMTNYFISKGISYDNKKINNINELYLKKEGNLDFKMILLKFQEAIKEKFSKSEVLKSEEFLENDLRLLFLMFLKPIINGYGFTFKEVQTGAEKRLDIVVVYKTEKFIVELKLWKGNEAHKNGIEQLKQYMEAESTSNGYMLIMNKNKKKEFKSYEDDGIFCLMI